MSLELETYLTKSIQNQKLISPKLYALAYKFAYTYGCEDFYADKKSVIEYPRYLFREDIRQKWTTDKTVDNLCVFPSTVKVGSQTLRSVNGFSIYDFKDTADLFNNFIQYQFNFVPGVESENKKKAVLKDRIRFFDMVCTDNFDISDVVDVLTDINVSGLNIKPLCAVCHQDEDYEHVHFLYLLDPSMTLKKRDLKRIPHIETIIRERYSKKSC